MNDHNDMGTSPDFIELFACGEALDAVDAGMESLDVSVYRDLLRKARHFILHHWGHPKLSRECHRSGALGDLYEFTEHEKRLGPKLAMLKDDTVVSVYSYTNKAANTQLRVAI